MRFCQFLETRPVATPWQLASLVLEEVGNICSVFAHLYRENKDKHGDEWWLIWPEVCLLALHLFHPIYVVFHVNWSLFFDPSHAWICRRVLEQVSKHIPQTVLNLILETLGKAHHTLKQVNNYVVKHQKKQYKSQITNHHATNPNIVFLSHCVFVNYAQLSSPAKSFTVNDLHFKPHSTNSIKAYKWDISQI